MTRALRWSIAISWAIHGLALVAMITVLAPGVDMQAPVAVRAAFVAANPLRWRVGWLAWQLTAASDLAVSVLLALVAWRAPRARWWGAFGLAATLLAIAPDQLGELRMVTAQVAAAGEAGTAAGLQRYLELEAWLLTLTGTFGCAGYAAMSAGWMLALRALAPADSRWRPAAFAALGSAMCVAFALCAITNGLAASRATVAGGYPGFSATFALNALAFPVLMAWMAWMIPLVPSLD